MTGADRPQKLSAIVVCTYGPDALCQTLDSIQTLADEILVVNGSADPSVGKLARRRATAVVNGTEEHGDDALRNLGLSEARGDWLLMLEAGECFDPEEAERLRAHVDGAETRPVICMMLVRSACGTGDVGVEQMGQPRLWPAGTKLRFTGGVRPVLGPSSEVERLGVEPLPVSIETGSATISFENRTRRTHRQLKQALEQMAREGTSAALLNCQGEACQALGQHDASAHLYREAVMTAEPGSTALLEAYYGLVSSLDARGDDRAVVLNVCLEALEHFPLDLQLLCAMGGYLQALGRVDLAARSYEVARQYGQINPEVWHVEQAHAFVTQCHQAASRLAAG